MSQKNGPMVRAQVLLTPEIRRRLERLAAREGRSLSDVTRRALDAGLRTLEGDPDEALQRELRALEELAQLRQMGRSRYGIYRGDLVAESRREREQDGEQVWQSQS